MKKIFYLCIMLLLIPTYVNAGQINANYGIESGGSVSSNGNLVGNFNKSGLSNSLSGKYYYTDSSIIGHTEWFSNSCTPLTRGTGPVADVTFAYSQKGLITYSVSNNYTFSGGGIGFNIAYYNSLSVDVAKNVKGEAEISCRSICYRIWVRRKKSCRSRTRCDYSPMCTSANGNANKFINNVKNRYYSDGNQYTPLINRLQSKYRTPTINTNLKMDGNNIGIQSKLTQQICRRINTDGDILKIDNNNCIDFDINNWLREWNTNNSIKTVYMVRMRDNAYIDKLTGKVRYVSSNNYINDANNYIAEGPKYFLPLNYTKDKLRVYSNSSNLSTYYNARWTSNFNYDVDVLHKYYNVKNNKVNGYAFKYRTISLNDAFPNDNAGDNWINYIRKDLYTDQKFAEGETYIVNNYDDDNLKKYNLYDNNGNMVLPTIKFNNKLDDSNVQYSAVIGSNNNETGANIGMTETRDDNSKSTYRYGFNNGYLSIAGKSSFNDSIRKNNITYYKIGCGRIYNGLQGGGCP